ncbi:MAG: hypothetical protein ACJ8F7_15995 [Gemmataceae bacterium]
MPERILILKAVAAAFAVAAVLALLGRWPWRAPRPGRVSAMSAVGVGAGLLVGCRLLSLSPHWPPQDVHDRWLFVLVPAVVLVEILAASVWLLRPLRAIIAAAAAPILLAASVYVEDLAGPGSREWSTTTEILVFAGLAVVLVANWKALDTLASRTNGRPVLLSLGLASAGAAVTIALSSYATGGQAGLLLAGVLGGLALTPFLFFDPRSASGAIGVGVVSLFALVVGGRFFGELATTHAALLFFAPMLAWLPELPGIRRIDWRLRILAGVVLVVIPVTVAATQAMSAHDARGKASPNSVEGSRDDYANFK